MTFSGLPSVRDPKQSLKNSSSSTSSTSSTSSNGSSSSSSSSSSPVKSPLTTSRNVDPTTSPQLNTQTHGHPVVVATEGMMNRHSVEKSFEELVQSNFMDRPELGMSQISSSFLPTTSPSYQELQIQQHQQQQMPAPAPGSTPTPVAPMTKKKAGPVNTLDPTQHAAYRKRLNVNQGKISTSIDLAGYLLLDNKMTKS